MLDPRTLTFRFYADLNDFLPPARRGVPFTHRVDGAASVKDAIEALGVPHPEVALILANGASVGFGYGVQDADRFSVFPAFTALSLSGVAERAGPEPLRPTRFVLDTHLGRLAAHLRMLGFDTLYRNDYADDELARVSHGEGRLLLTRDLGLLKRSLVRHGYFVRSQQPREQVVEILGRFGLRGEVAPFTRCARCNVPLVAVDKEAVADRLPEETRRHFDHFRQCTGCGRVYWRGSHFQQLEAWVGRVVGF